MGLGTFCATASEGLPENLMQMIDRKIAGVSVEEKEMVLSWSPGKQLAEFFCQDRALVELGETFAGADRVFLSMRDDEPPQMIGDNRIKAPGSVRYDGGWADFTYECEVDLKSGDVTEFSYEARP